MSAPSTDAGANCDVLVDVLLEYLKAVDAGRPPDARELLAAHPELADDLREFLDDQEAVARQARPLRDVLANVPVEPPAARVPDLAGYDSLRFLAEGGMGTVYLAWQALARREVAVKVIRGGALAGPTERQRFLIEAQR